MKEYSFRALKTHRHTDKEIARKVSKKSDFDLRSYAKEHGWSAGVAVTLAVIYLIAWLFVGLLITSIEPHGCDQILDADWWFSLGWVFGLGFAFGLFYWIYPRAEKFAEIAKNAIRYRRAYLKEVEKRQKRKVKK